MQFQSKNLSVEIVLLMTMRYAADNVRTLVKDVAVDLRVQITYGKCIVSAWSIFSMQIALAPNNITLF